MVESLVTVVDRNDEVVQFVSKALAMKKNLRMQTSEVLIFRDKSRKEIALITSKERIDTKSMACHLFLADYL